MAAIEKGSHSSAIIAARQVRMAEDRQSVPLPHAHHAIEPRLEYIRDGDSIAGVEITCGCGQRIRIRFEYESTAKGV